MNLGQIFATAAIKNFSLPEGRSNPIRYQEWEDEGKFKIKLSTSEDKDAFIFCELPKIGTEEEKNYLRMYLLSMVFNAAIYDMKKQKFRKNKKL